MKLTLTVILTLLFFNVVGQNNIVQLTNQAWSVHESVQSQPTLEQQMQLYIIRNQAEEIARNRGWSKSSKIEENTGISIIHMLAAYYVDADCDKSQEYHNILLELYKHFTEQEGFTDAIKTKVDNYKGKYKLYVLSSRT